jgi:hypothetical protein
MNCGEKNTRQRKGNDAYPDPFDRDTSKDRAPRSPAAKLGFLASGLLCDGWPSRCDTSNKNDAIR